MRHRASASLLLASIMLLTLAGCMSATIQESRELPTQIVDGEAVVILAKPQIEGVAAEDEFIDCVGRGLAKGERPITVRDNNGFIAHLGRIPGWIPDQVDLGIAHARHRADPTRGSHATFGASRCR